MPEPAPPRTADDYLRESMGALIAQLLVQAAVLRAENDQSAPRAQQAHSQNERAARG